MTEQQQKVVDAFSDLQILQKEMAKDPEKEELFDDVVSKLGEIGLELCAKFDLSPAQLSNEWDILAIETSQKLTVDNLTKVEIALRTKKATRQVQKAREDEAMDVDNPPTEEKIDLGFYGVTFVTTPPPKKPVSRVSAVNSPIKMESPVKKRPIDQIATTDAARGSPVKHVKTAYSQRSTAGKLELSYPPDQISLAPPIPNIKSSDVTINIEKESGVQAPYRYMWDTNPARASTQANRIEKISKTILALSQLPVEEDPAPFNVPNQASIVAIGQVVGEGEGLNEKTLTLQRNNVRAKIDVTDMKNYSLFSGQVVAIQGVNAYGSRIVAESIHCDATLPHFVPGLNGLDKEEIDLRKQELRVMVASGPFTSRTDMLYEPLDDLLNKVQERKPHALILLGPFVDSEHPEVAGTQLSKTFDEIFEDTVVKIASHLENIGTRIILVPSLRDVHHEFVFPQPPFELSPEARYPNLVLVSNPSTFRINGISFGVVTNDVLRHLAGMSVTQKESDKTTDGRERVAQLTAHVIEQQSYYPLYPPPAGSAGEVNLDVSHWFKCSLPYTPDVMLFCSNLPQFIRPMHGVLCINAGRLVTGKSGGTYAELQLTKASDSQTATVIGRSRVAITRI